MMAWASVVVLVMLLALVGVAAYGVALYNGLVQVKHQVDQAWSNIDVLLKQRHDELPKLVDAVKGYMRHESELLQSVTALRARAQSTAAGAPRLAAEQSLSQGVARLLAVAESYPELRASSVYLTLQQRISALEDQISHRREFYNAAVNINNVRMEQFPDMLFAATAGLVRRASFETTDGERADLNVGARLGS